jgi:predicted nucleic acid-binding protein
VLGANVLASGIAGISRPQSTPGEVLRRWRANAFTLVVSQPILDELLRTLTNPYFAARLSPTEVEANLLRLRTEARLQSITVRVSGRATHPQDDLILATALSGHAKYLVTGTVVGWQLAPSRLSASSPRAIFSLTWPQTLTNSGESNRRRPP